MATELHDQTWVNRPPQSPPSTQIGPLGWLRKNLFSSVGNSLLTVITVAVLYFALTGLANWILDAFWLPIWQNRKLFAIGPYPSAQVIQPLMVLMLICFLFGVSAARWGSLLRDLSIGLAALLGVLALLPLGATTQMLLGAGLGLLIAGYILGSKIRFSSRILTLAWIATLPLTLILLAGGITIPFIRIGVFFTQPLRSNLWGGLMLTVLLTVVGIGFSFPLGVLLALGRRSAMPVIRLFCIAYIELIRGAPLITLLFMGMVMLPLFLPPTFASPAAVVRVMVAITLFSSAYLAENVRGGLQAIPKGQYEAADALGLNTFDKLRLIILPQALTKVIPAIVGQFISLFKDTSLVALVGLLDLLGVARSVIQQPDWLGIPGGITKEVYLFIGIVYFIFSYGMSVASRRLETELRVGSD